LLRLSVRRNALWLLIGDTASWYFSGNSYLIGYGYD